MPETLTESFCERCGTRYTFESAAPKGKRLGKIKVLSKGFVNFVSNDDRSLDEAFAEARSDEQREQTSQQLDAFHQTFQFCMSCRQYTCANCWNEVESRCLSCAPQFGADNLSFPAAAEPLARILSQTEPEPLAANGHLNGGTGLATPAPVTPPEESAWPTSDRARDGDPSALPWPGLPALPAVAGPSVDEPSVEAAVEAPTAGVEAISDALEVAAAEIAPVEAEPVPEVLAQEDIVDEDVALAVAAAERARHAAAEAEAQAERQRLAAEEADAERQRLAAEEADAERQRLAAEEAEAEQARQAVAQMEAERQRLAAEEAAQREREVAAAAESERQRQSADEEAQRARQAAVEAEALRQRLAVEAELQREREAAAAAERQREAERLAAAAELSPPPAPREDRVETPTWQIVAPEVAPTPDSDLLDVPPTTLAPQPSMPARPAATNGGVQPTNGAAGAVNGAPTPPTGASEWPSPANTPPPQWPMPKPVAPQWPVGQGTSRGANDDLWAASSQDVLGKAGSGVQPCTSCGLPLSATARFCRRCGTQQH
jgi:hypothetical protein